MPGSESRIECKSTLDQHLSGGKHGKRHVSKDDAAIARVARVRHVRRVRALRFLSGHRVLAEFESQRRQAAPALADGRRIWEAQT